MSSPARSISSYIIGVDFGTDTVPAVLADARTGAKQAQAIYAYPWWQTRQFCHSARHQFRQQPLDHLEGIKAEGRVVTHQRRSRAGQHAFLRGRRRPGLRPGVREVMRPR